MYKNPFMATNFKEKLNRLILNILQGLNIKENQQKLNEYRKSSDYPLLLCQILVQSMQMPFMSMNQLQDHKKNFVALQIKKISSRTSNDQCWRLMREVYFTEPDKKVVSLIRQTCLLYHPPTPQNNLIYLFLDLDLNHKGIKGVIRYVTFVHQLVRREFRELQNTTMKEYGDNVLNRLKDILLMDVADVVMEAVVTAIILVSGILGGVQLEMEVAEWQQFMSTLANSSSPLIRCLVKHFIHEIGSNYKNITIFTCFQFNQDQVTQALHYCLAKTANLKLSIEQRFYFDCIQILSLYWVKNVRKFTSNQQLEASQIMALDVIQTYSEEFSEREQEDGCRVQFGDQEEDKDEIDNELNTKRLSFLRTVLYMYPQQKLMGLIQSRTNYSIQIMQFSLHLATLVRDNFVPSSLLQTLLDNLQTALKTELDTYLFIQQKSTFIFTLLKYVAKFYHTFDRELIFRVCYLVDFLVYKCDTIAEEGFKMLDVLVDKVMDLEGFVLVEFLETTLSHINENDWVESNTCYFHAINILLNLSPQLLFQRSSQPYYNYEFSVLQKQILTMVRKMIQLLQKSFNYQSMHKLNALLQYLLQPLGIHLIQALRYDLISWVVMTNFKYQILTDTSGQVYFYFIQFSDNRLSILDSLDQYHFWKQCDSQRLIFFSNIYTKLIDSKENFFTSSQTEHKVVKLRKYLWERYRAEMDQDERDKIVGMFAKNPKYFTELCVEAYQVQKWSQNRKEYWGQSEVRAQRQHRGQKMEIQ